MESGNQSVREVTKRRRAAYVCRTCRGRKVKCDVGDSGPPCRNCTRDNLTCEVLPGTGYRAAAWQRRLQLLSQAKSSPKGAVASQIPRDQEPEGNRILSYGDAGRSRSSSQHGGTPKPTVGPLRTHQNEDSTQSQDEDEGENSIAFSATLDGPSAGEDTMPFYIGDSRGSGFVTGSVDLGNCSNKSHFLVPRSSSRTIPPVELAFLRDKGVFKLPDQAFVSTALKTYFSHVHLFLPIIDPSFLLAVEQGGAKELSPLLFWSLVFATGSFLDSEFLASAGYKSRKAFKRLTYERAKTLYVVDFEQNKITLIQSVLLLSFWTNDAEDRTGAWHWNGIAISLCHTLGMHRDPRSRQPLSTFLSDSDCRLWRLIWWTSYSREAWLSLALGRPMRVSISDCDQIWPSFADIESLTVDLPNCVKIKYFPDSFTNLFSLWDRWINLTKKLGLILETSYRPNSIKMSIKELEKQEEEIRSLHSNTPSRLPGADRLTLLNQRQIDLYLEAIVITLYRPYVLNHNDEIARLQSDAFRKARTAASNCSSFLNDLVNHDMLQHCQSYTVIALLPAMQIHLIESGSSSSLLQKVGLHHLNMCMIVMEELRKTYWGADFVAKFYKAAQKKMMLPVTQTPQLMSADNSRRPQSNQPGRSLNSDGFTTPPSGNWNPSESGSSSIAMTIDSGAFDEFNNMTDFSAMLGAVNFGDSQWFNSIYENAF